MKIVFMGTPDFAVPSLQTLIDNGYNVVAVITATDKYGGRGGKVLIESAVKKCAIKNEIPVLQPKNLKASSFVEELRSYNADIQFVVAFRMLPEIVWNMPAQGTYNLHGSLLPKYRGAAPINWAVINGDDHTGVTTFKLKHEIDTGDTLIQTKIDILPDDTAGDVHDKMMLVGADALLETIRLIEKGNYDLLEQDISQVSKAPKIFTETCRIDWNKSVQDVHNFVRGLSPFPTSWCKLDDKKLKIFKSKLTCKLVGEEKAGSTKISENKTLLVACKDYYLEIMVLQIEGKRRMDVKDFLNGYSHPINVIQ